MPRHSYNGEISRFENYFISKSSETTDIMRFLTSVQSGVWKDEVLSARKYEKDSEEYNKIKKSLPCFTISGTFNPKRFDENLLKHSGFICMDFDNLPEVENLHKKLQNRK